jgi:hypothetical protein
MDTNVSPCNWSMGFQNSLHHTLISISISWTNVNKHLKKTCTDLFQIERYKQKWISSLYYFQSYFYFPSLINKVYKVSYTNVYVIYHYKNNILYLINTWFYIHFLYFATYFLKQNVPGIKLIKKSLSDISWNRVVFCQKKNRYDSHRVLILTEFCM